jgi:polysaccharide biosynthesis protein PslJ
MTLTPDETRRYSSVSAVLIASSLALLAVSTVSGAHTGVAAGMVVILTLAAISKAYFVAWPQLIAALIAIILFVPIRRYALPGSLPFQLEPYRVFVALLIVGWVVSLLVDPRVRFRRTGFEGPLTVIAASVLASVVANPGRVGDVSSVVDKKLMFFFSFVLVLYLTVSVVRRLDNIDYLIRALVSGGAVVAFFAIVEARTGFNVFDHLHRVVPGLSLSAETGGFVRMGTAKLRVFASAQHPIALSAALVMLTPLALYLARRYRQRRWLVCAIALVAGSTSTVSRTGVIMFAVVGIVFLWLRPRETMRLWPALLLAPVAIHFALPGTLGAIKQSFMPAGGLIAEQQSQPGESGSGRLADLGPGLEEWKRQPLVGQGFGTRVVDESAGNSTANILDNQWLGTLLETGALGFFGWLWFFARVLRRFGAEAKRDESDRGWLLATLAAGVAAFAVGMITLDAFAFIQVTFLLFIFVGLGSALLAERPTPVAVRIDRGRGGAPKGQPAPAAQSV